MPKKSLDELLEDNAGGSLEQFDDDEPEAMNEADFQRHKQKVFKAHRSSVEQRRVANQVRDLDAEAERRKKRQQQGDGDE